MTHKPPSKQPERSNKQDIQAFLSQVNKTPARKTPGTPGRLLFAIDATASRQPTWDQACHLQAEMFKATESIGGLKAQLCYYRGFSDFYVGQWHANTTALLREMTAVQCLGGHTQIARVLEHAIKETRRQRINAVVFIGDALEESADDLCQLAGKLGLLGVPLFLFHEGYDPKVKNIFQQMSQLSGGAYCPFNEQSAGLLAELLGAVAVFASGGRQALQDYSAQKSPELKALVHQVQADYRSGKGASSK